MVNKPRNVNAEFILVSLLLCLVSASVTVNSTVVELSSGSRTKTVEGLAGGGLQGLPSAVKKY